MPEKRRQNVIKNRREAVRERVKQYRERLKIKKQQQHEMENPKTPRTVVQESYACSQTLGKAVKKVTIAFPSSPRKKKAVLLHMVSKFDDDEKNEIVQVLTSPPVVKSRTSDEYIHEVNRAIQSFLERDDISRVSAKARDVKTYSCPETGNELLLPTRHMVLSMKEAYAIFVDERKNAKKGISKPKIFIS